RSPHLLGTARLGDVPNIAAELVEVVVRHEHCDRLTTRHTRRSDDWGPGELFKPGETFLGLFIDWPADASARHERLKQTKRRRDLVTVSMVPPLMGADVDGKVARHPCASAGASSSFFASSFLASARLNSCSRTGLSSFLSPSGHFAWNGLAANIA